MVSCSCRENRFHLAKVKLKNSQWHIYIDFEQKTVVHQVFFFSASCLTENEGNSRRSKKKKEMKLYALQKDLDS